ncbi:MAG: hypothetical protein JXR14_01870 [Paracoccaceae bacterium]
MFSSVRKFIRDETGAVTVDWVVLTAAVMGLGLFASSSVWVGTEALSETISDNLESQSIQTAFE